jgi:hypothetical protein
LPPNRQRRLAGVIIGALRGGSSGGGGGSNNIGEVRESSGYLIKLIKWVVLKARRITLWWEDSG